MTNVFPETIRNVVELEELLSRPSDAASRALERAQGDILILGVAGKMGPTLARMARRACDSMGDSRRVIGVSRFSSPGAEKELQTHGVETIRGDLLSEDFLNDLPDAPNILFMAGMKFGSSENASMTWAMNVLLPSLVCRRFRGSRIVAFSTGNVYPFAPVESGGWKETDPTGPVGEYAMTALGRERIFDYFSRTLQIPTALVRLNYATEMRYGVLVDLAQRVWAEEPIDLAMGYLNAIWQADANAMAIASMADAHSPPFVFNLAGPERVRVRDAAERFASLMNKQAVFVGEEAPTALLSDGSEAIRRYGPLRADAKTMIGWIADWVMRDGVSLKKPTHFEVRNGQF